MQSAQDSPQALIPAVSRRKGKSKFVWLSSLRALGVVLVLIYHFYPDLLPGGFIGVDIFFVFSGFLITSLLIREFSTKGRINLASFYWRRLMRLLPAIIAMLFLILPLSLLISPDFRVGISQQIAGVLGWVTNFYEIANGQSYANQLLPHLFVHTWTLSIEMQYYVFWGVLLWLVIPLFSYISPDGRCSTKRARHILLVVAIILALGSFILMQVFLVGAQDPSMAYFNTASHFFPLMIGSAVGLVAGFSRTKVVAAFEKMPGKAGLAIVIVSVLAIIALARLLPFENILVYRFGLLLTSLLVALMLLIGRGLQKRLSKVRENRFLTYLADRSYSLYLFHWPLLIIAENLGKPGSPFVIEDFVFLTSSVFPTIALILTFVLAHLSYRFVEQRFTSQAKAAREKKTARAKRVREESHADLRAETTRTSSNIARPGATKTISNAVKGETAKKRTQSQKNKRKKTATRIVPVAPVFSHVFPKRLASSHNIYSILVRTAVALVLVVVSVTAVRNAPDMHEVTALNNSESLLLSEGYLTSLDSSFANFRPDPVVGLGQTTGLPTKPSEGESDSSLATVSLENMQRRLSGGGGEGTITVLGDSLCLNAASRIVEVTGAYVDADGYRAMQDAVPLIEELQGAGALGEFVVIAMATNIFDDSPARAQQIVDIMEPGHHLIFVTAHGIDLEYFGLDAFIRDLPNRYPWVSIADWNAAISGQDNLLSPDGIHVSGEVSREIYVQCIVDAIDEARGGPVS